MENLAMLVVDNSKKSITAEKLLKSEKIEYASVFVDRNEIGIPTLIYEGMSYRGIEGIKVFINSGLINNDISFNK